MQITQETPTAITLKDDNLMGIVVGVIFSIASIGITPLAFSPQQPNTGVILILSLVFLVTGIALVLNSYFTTIIFDKGANKISFIRKGLLGTKNSDYALNTLTKLELRERYSVTTDRTANNLSRTSTRLEYQIFLIFNDGREIPLDHLRSSGNFSVSGIPLGGGTGNERTIGEKLATFLNVSFSDPGVPPLGGAINTIVSTIKTNLHQNPPTTVS